MKFTTHEDIGAPIEYVFERASDFSTFERSALRRGADIQRKDSLSSPGVGAAWAIRFPFRGKTRSVAANLQEFDAPNRFTIFSLSGGIESLAAIDLVALSKTRTRVSVYVDLKPQNLSARLLIQSLKLAKNSLNQRFRKRIANFAQECEDGYSKQR